MSFREESWTIKKTTLKGDLLRKHIWFLQKQGIVVHTGKIQLDRDVMVRWVNLVFEYDMGATVEQIKVLSRYYFLVIVCNHDEKQWILGESPLYMDGRKVAAIPWDIDLNSRPIGPLDTHVWIDLMMVDPLLEIHAAFILKQVGRMVFSLTSANLSKFAHIRGCILVNLDESVPC